MNAGLGGGNDIAVLFSPVPEPGVVLGVAALVLGIGARIRRRRCN